MVHWIKPKIAIDINKHLAAKENLNHIVYKNLLEGALHAPINHHEYNGTNDMAELAAIYIRSIAKDHCFADGNKRTSLLVGVFFLMKNNYYVVDTKSLSFPTEANNNQGSEFHTKIVHLVEKKIELPEISQWIKDNFFEAIFK